MVVHFVCADCGAYGSISVESRAGVFRCPRCISVLSVERTGDAARTVLHENIDDDIVSWVSRPSASPEARPNTDITCSDCGYVGMMPYESNQGDAICPACMAVHRRKPPRGYGTVACPGCGRAVEYSDVNRGRSIICPGCKYFLGCLVPPEKHTYRARGRR